jgi:predicted alpha/beta superfamily hydrolase
LSELLIVRDFASVPEGFARTLRIFLPDAYAFEPHRRFPVLYMQDGQNVFDHPDSARWDTWGVNTSMQKLVAERSIDPWIVVAVDHGAGRFEEYSLWPEIQVGSLGRGEAYLRFLVEQLKPHVDRSFHTLPEATHTAMVGSSLGGLISLCAHARFPGVFGRIGAFSPTVMWAGHALFELWRERTLGRIYLDVGADEKFMIDDYVLNYGEEVLRFHHHLRSLGYGPEQVQFFGEPDAEHSEADWRRRFPNAMRWLLRRS